MDRITYRDSFVEANGVKLQNVTSLGIDGDTQEEKLYELGVDDYNTPQVLPNVTVSLESREFGDLTNLQALLGTDGKYIRFKRDVDNSKTDIRIPVKVEEGTTNDTIWTHSVREAVLTSYNLNYSVDGDATENYSLKADNKKLYFKNIYVGTATGDPITIVIKGADIKSADETGATVYLNGTELLTETTDYTAEFVDGSITITPVDEKIEIGDEISVAIQKKYTAPTKSTNSSTRRGQVKVYLVKDITSEELKKWQASTGDTDTLNGFADDKKLRIDKLQTLSLDIPLEREDLAQLGNAKPYARPLTLPLNITANLDFIASDNKVLAWFMGKTDFTDITEAFDTSKLKKDLGLIIEVYETWDLDRTSTDKALKIIEIPKFTINSDNFNVGSDGGNAAQSFGISAEDACVYTA